MVADSDRILQFGWEFLIQDKRRRDVVSGMWDSLVTASGIWAYLLRARPGTNILYN